CYYHQSCQVCLIVFEGESFLYFWWSFNPCLYSQKCSLFHSAIHEFPEDIFTKGQRRHGAILLHVFCAVYMFYALAIVCDVYFVPSLEKICENLHLSEDVAGATFMAAGSSAPELFTSLIGVFITKGDLGLGTIVGSAVFNILVIIGVCGIFAGQVTITLTWWPLFRDSIYYILSVLALILVSRSMTVITSLSLSLSGQNAGGQDSPVVMVDELMSLHPHQFSFSEASLRVMITPHFSPRTRLSMAGRMLITEVLAGSDIGDTQPKDDEEEEEEEEEADEEQPFRPLTVWVLSWPLGCLLYYSVPNCVLPRWERWFMVTFVASTLWIAVFSYLMVWMVTIISFTLDIPDVVMGITFLAAGTSVPDCMASLIVARQGMGDMAVSNSIGSNIFDILLGLGFPWALRTLVVDYGSTVFINSKGLLYSVILLLASVFLTVLSVYLNHWRLDRRLGLGLMFLYAIFLCWESQYSYNIYFLFFPMIIYCILSTGQIMNYN
uniref:Solute carrier family 24 member 6a n=1 Tax=Sinocyclocheilus rhinocerous TaxID=307959 RepID=A0A673LZW5_9TELE